MRSKEMHKAHYIIFNLNRAGSYSLRATTVLLSLIISVATTEASDVTVKLRGEDNSRLEISHLRVSDPKSDPKSGQFILDLHSESGKFNLVLNEGKNYRFTMCDSYLFKPLQTVETITGHKVSFDYPLSPLNDLQLIIHGHMRPRKDKPFPQAIELHDEATQCLIQTKGIQSSGSFGPFNVSRELEYSMLVKGIKGDGRVKGAKGEYFVELAFQQKNGTDFLTATMCEFDKDKRRLTRKSCDDCNSLTTPLPCRSTAPDIKARPTFHPCPRQDLKKRRLDRRNDK